MPKGVKQMIYKERLIIPRNIITRNLLSSTEFAVYLSMVDLYGAHDRKVLATTSQIYYNLFYERDPAPTTIKEIDTAIKSLIKKKLVVGEKVQKGAFLIECGSFYVDTSKLAYGFVVLDFAKVRKIMQQGGDKRTTKGLLLYYFELMSHMDANGTCRKSLQLFSENTGISVLTLSKYNGILQKLELIRIQYNHRSTSTYFAT